MSKICDVCGRECPNTICFERNIDHKDPSGKIYKESDYALKIFGKLDFVICFTCWLLSLGVKGEKELVKKHLEGKSCEPKPTQTNSPDVPDGG